MFTVWSVEEEERRGRVGWRERCQQRSRWPEVVEMSVRLIGGDVVSIGNSSVLKRSPRSSVASREVGRFTLNAPAPIRIFVLLKAKLGLGDRRAAGRAPINRAVPAV